MDNLSNTSLNYTSPHPLRGPGFLVFNVVMLLGVVLPVITADTVILVALVLESSIVKVVRLVLGSILVSCLLLALGLAMYHISGMVLNQSPVNSPPSAPCTITVFLISFGGAARLVFMATFSVMVYIIAKYGKATKKRYLVASFITVMFLWVIAFLGTSPLFVQAIVHTSYIGSLSCGSTPVATSSYIFLGLYVFFFGFITLSVTIILLVSTVCYIKRLTIQHIKLEKATVKFGFFLLLGNGINLLGQIVPPLIITSILPQQASSGGQPLGPAERAVTYTAYTLPNAALIPTPILVLIYFKPIRERLWRWMCCCMPKIRKAKCIFKSNTVEVHRAQMDTTRL